MMPLNFCNKPFGHILLGFFHKFNYVSQFGGVGEGGQRGGRRGGSGRRFWSFINFFWFFFAQKFHYDVSELLQQTSWSYVPYFFS